MIKGVNEFRLNMATVAQAIEDYLNAVILDEADYVMVSSVNERSTSGGQEFVCKVRPKSETSV